MLSGNGGHNNNAPNSDVDDIDANAADARKSVYDTSIRRIEALHSSINPL